MQFWIRHLVLVIVCVVLPFGAALYFDTLREVDRAETAGLQRAEQAAATLKSSLELQARKRATDALNLAQHVSVLENLKDLEGKGARREAAFAALQQVLDASVADRAEAFAWYVNAAGEIVLATGQTAPEPDAELRSVVGHPVFVQTQQGYVLDALWSPAKPLTRVAAAPVIVEDAAFGAVILGAPVRKDDLQSEGAVAVSLVRGDALELSAGDGEETAKALLAAKGQDARAFMGGRLAQPIAGATYIPGLPILVDRHANNRAFAGSFVPVRGAPAELRWMVAVAADEGLGSIAERQEILLGGLLASILLAVLVGLVNYRTFVKPLDTVAEHLSELQQGRGDLELPEARVSRPFRRVVRLINMTVQRMPMRTMAPISPTSFDLSQMGGSPSQDLTSPKPVTSDLSAPPPAAPPPVAAPKSSPDLPAVSAPESFGAPTPEPAADVAFEQANGPMGGVETDDEIAAAIASLEASTSAPAMPSLPPPPPPTPRAASEIRGGMPRVEESPFGETTPGAGIRGGGSLDFGSQDLSQSAGTSDVMDDEFRPEATVVAPVQEDLLAQSARDDLTDGAVVGFGETDKPDLTVVANVPPDLLAQSAQDEVKDNGPLAHLDLGDREHFKEVYERFLDMRRKCGEKTADLAFERFMSKLSRNRENLIKKYSCRTVRFQVYEKDGKAALKATPVRAR